VAEALVRDIVAGVVTPAPSTSTSPIPPHTRRLEAVLEAGPIQILVNNAGVHDDAVLPGMSRKHGTG